MANRFLVAGGTGNWNSTTNWAATSGGSSGASFPVAGDVVAFDSLSGNANMTVNTASACASLIMSGTYAGTLTFDSTLTLTSTCTFLAGCTIAGTAGTLITAGTATYTSGGKTLTCALTFSTSSTITLGDSWTVNGLVTTAASPTVNSNTLHCVGGLHSNASSTIGGSVTLSLEGGTWDNAGSTNIQASITIAGNVTVSGTVVWGSASKSLTYTSGTVTVTSSTLSLQSGLSYTINTHGLTWNNITVGGGGTYTLSSNLEWSGTLTLNGSASTFTSTGTLNGTGAFTISAAHTITLNNTGGLVTTGTLTLPNGATTFAGTAGFTVGTFTSAVLTASRIFTLTQANTYRVTAAISCGATATARAALISSSAGNKVPFILSAGAVQTLAYMDPTDIDSSAGATVITIGGTITTTTNWLGSALAGWTVCPPFPVGGGLISGRQEPMDVPLDEVVYFDAITANQTGAATDADSAPTFAVYEEATDTDIGVAASMTKRTSLTGNYRGTFTCSAANGFELGKWYSVIGSVTVAGVVGKAVLWRFRIIAAELVPGYPMADLAKWIGVAPLALSSQQVQAIVPDAQKVDVNTIKAQVITCSAGVTVEPFVGTVTAALVVDASGRTTLAPAGLDAIAVTDPGAPASMTTIPKMIVALWRWFYKKTTLSSTTLTTYADDGTTANATATVSDTGTLQTKGTLS